MAKTLRVRSKTGWVTKDPADLPENRLTAAEVDDNFLSIENAVETIVGNLTAGDGASLVGFQQAGAGAVVRTAHDKMREWVSVKDFGAVGDGVADDTAAIQSAIDSGAKRVYFPAGTYYASQSIKLPHTGSYFRKDTGITISGDGIYTILTRGNATDVATTDESLWPQRSFFSVYGSNNIIENLQFSECPIGIYFGQDPAKIGVELSHTSFNRMRNLLIQDCGTGILSACAQGHYYNHYEAIHIAQSQIGVHFTAHSVWGSNVSNNNRNTFVNVRASRCQVGFWLANGNTNSVYSFHCEGCGSAPTNNAYSSPAGLPGGLTSAAHIVTTDNNGFFGCVHESCDFYLYQSGLFNSYIGCLYRVNEEPAKSIFTVAPNHWISRSETWLSGGAFASLSNMNASAFPNTPAGAAVVRGTSIFPQVYGGGADIRSTAIAETYARDQIFQLGGVSSGGSASFTLWQEDVAPDQSAAALFDVSVLGNSQENSLAHASTFKVVALRNSARTLTRYYLYGQVNGRATGAAAGDSSEPLTPSLTVGGASGKDLIVTITAPARTFANVSAVVRRIHSQPA